MDELGDMYIEEIENITKRIPGFMGTFNTSDSFTVGYIQTSLTMKDLDLLSIASDAFKFDQVDFEEIVQRDVDRERVYYDIVEGYLKKGKEKALFFPPLIVSVIAFDNKDKPVRKFENVGEKTIGNKIEKQWDNYFKIQVVKSDNDSGFYYKDKQGIDHSIHAYASSIMYDENRVKLVVIDGQHRFVALKELYRIDKNRVKDICLPICICFSPDAIQSNGSQDVMLNLRNMFVTINNKSKSVSGNFLDLLDDSSIASYCVRSLADKWKRSSEDSLRSDLQFIEWNQKLKSKSSQTNKRFSITTVSIVADVLEKEIFCDSKVSSKTFNLLGLSFAKDILETKPSSVPINQISDDNFDLDQIDVLKKLIEDNFTPCLHILLSEPSVYKIVRSSYYKALEYLEKKVASGAEGYETVLDLLKVFKETDKLSSDKVKIAERDFNQQISFDPAIENYRRNVFHQGYIRTWAEVADFFVTKYEIPPIITAKAIVSGFEKLVFNTTKDIFGKNNIYTNLVLYVGKPNVQGWGKKAWKNLIAATLIDKNTSLEMSSVICKYANDNGISLDSKNIIDDLVSVGQASLLEYNKELYNRIHDEFRTNWRIKEFPKVFKDELEKLNREDNSESKKEFHNMLELKANDYYTETIIPLCNILNIDTCLLTDDIWECIMI